MTARSLGVADRVTFLGHRADAVDLYAGFDLIVFTSRYEGLPFTVLEAMGLGIPVVALRIPGMDEAIVDRETGRLLDSAGRGKSLASAIIGSTLDRRPAAQDGRRGPGTRDRPLLASRHDPEDRRRLSGDPALAVPVRWPDARRPSPPSR